MLPSSSALHVPYFLVRPAFLLVWDSYGDKRVPNLCDGDFPERTGLATTLAVALEPSAISPSAGLPSCTSPVTLTAGLSPAWIL